MLVFGAGLELANQKGKSKPFNKTMRTIKTIRLCGVASAIALSAALAGCNNHSQPESNGTGNAAERPSGDEANNTPDRPNLDDVRAAVAQVYGDCPLWSISDISRNDGAPNAEGYEISYSFVLTFKAGADWGTTPGLVEKAPFGCQMGLAALIPLSMAYKSASFAATGDRVFVHSEKGWHLPSSISGILTNQSTLDQFTPANQSAGQASQ